MPKVNNNIIELPKENKLYGTIYRYSIMFIGAVRNIVDAVDCVTKSVSKVAKITFGVIGHVAGPIGIVFAILHGVSNVSKMIYGSSVVERVKGAFNALANVGDLWNATNGLLSAMQVLGKIPASSLAWTGIVSAVLFPLQVIEIGNDTHQLKQTKEDRKNILSNLSVKDLTYSCKYVIENHESLRKSLCLTKHAKINEMAKNILLKGEAGRKEGEEFIKTLRRRIHTKHNLEFSGIILKSAAIGAGIGVLATGPNPISLGLAAGTGFAVIGHFGVGKLLLQKNPFSSPKNVWYAKLAEKMRNAFAVLTDAMAQRIDARFPFTAKAS